MDSQLVNGKYSFTDLVSIPQLERLFNQFSLATGFALSLVSYPDQKIIIRTGWQDICAKFHRASAKSEIHCIKSNKNLTINLEKQNAININYCQLGMIDGATPIIINGAHIANIFTGQVLFDKPDTDYFKNQSKKFGFNMDRYMEALKKITIVTEGKFKETLGFISEIAIMIAEQGLKDLKNKESENKLKIALLKAEKSESKLLEAQTISHIGNWKLDLTNNKLTWSDEVYKILSVNPQEFTPTYEKLIAIIHPEDRQLVNNTYVNSLINKKPFDIEHRLLLNNGELRYIREKCKSEFDKDGNPILSVGIIQDITNIKKTKKALDELEIKYRELFDKSGDAILILKNGKFTACNQAALKLLKYKTKEDLLNKYPSELSPTLQPDSSNSVEKAAEFINNALMNGQYCFEWEHVKSNGDIFPVEVLLTTILNEVDNQVIHVVLRDITTRKKAEQTIKESKEYLEQLTNSMWDAVFSVKMPERIIEWANDSYNILGYEPDEYIGNSTSFLYNDKSDFIAFGIEVQDALTARKDVLLTNYTLRRKNGETFPADITITFHRDMNIVSKITAIIRDVSNRAQMEKDLIAAKEKAEESDRLKSAFLANMSHEIRTPMNGILGFADLLKTPDLSGEELTKYTNIIERSGKRMLNIINDLIDISKIDAKQMEVKISECDINKQIKYIHTFFKNEAEKKGLNIIINNNIYASKTIIDTDREKLYAILTNLVKNSIKYTHNGTIKIGYIVKQLTDNNYLEFCIEDTGIGIPKSRQLAIFERFIQADIEDKQVYEGAGLGLAITKAYVKMLDGEIWVESSENIGSKFYFTIPIKSKTLNFISHQNRTSDTLTNNMKTNKLKILIAEDEEFADTYLTIILKDICNEFFHAKNGEEAVDIFRNNTDIDLILMDIRMPIISGYTATAKIRKISKTVKIIAQTAYALEGDRKKAINAGCDDYIPKPIDKQELFEIIDSFDF